VRRDDYNIEGEGGIKAAAGEYDSEYDATSMLASLVLLLAQLSE
jgi:hypothetical protein